MHPLESGPYPRAIITDIMGECLDRHQAGDLTMQHSLKLSPPIEEYMKIGVDQPKPLPLIPRPDRGLVAGPCLQPINASLSRPPYCSGQKTSRDALPPVVWMNCKMPDHGPQTGPFRAYRARSLLTFKVNEPDHDAILLRNELNGRVRVMLLARENIIEVGRVQERQNTAPYPLSFIFRSVLANVDIPHRCRRPGFFAVSSSRRFILR